MSHLPVVAGMSNQWLRHAMQALAAEHASAAAGSPALAMALDLTEKRINLITHVAAVDTSGAIEHLIRAAQQHGEDSEPDHEVGDLQDLLRSVWQLLTPGQRAAALRSQQVSDVLEGAMLEPLAGSLEDTHDWEHVCEFYGLDTSFQYGEDAVLEYTNMFRLEAVCADGTTETHAEAPERLRYVHGTWEHIFHPGRQPAALRLVYDRQEESLVAMELRCSGGWTFATAEEIADVEESLKNANTEAVDDPAGHGLEASADRPRWCAEEVRQLSRGSAPEPARGPSEVAQRERG